LSAAAVASLKTDMIATVKVKTGLRPMASASLPKTSVPTGAPRETDVVILEVFASVQFHSDCKTMDKKKSNILSIESAAKQGPNATRMRP
jgi:hypothetical protein